MKLLSLSSFKDNTADPTTTSRPSSSSSLWPWPPYCHQPRTLSFRGGDDVFRTINSAFLDPPEPWRRRRLANSPSFTSTEPGQDEEEEVGESERPPEDDEDAAIETAVTAARSERRLFFEPEETSCILDRSAAAVAAPCQAPFIEDSVAMSMESRDPYVDFRRSMGEMVDAHALRDKWDRLEELLCWFLRANDKTSHGYIFAAFVDLLVTIQASCNLSQSPSSPLSFYTSSTSNSCCSSSTLSTPCCVSVVEAEESSASSSESVAAVKSSSALNAAEPMADDSSSSSLDV